MEKTKNINISTEEFKQNLIKLIENCGLPIANIYLVWKLLLSEIESMYFVIVNEQEKEEEKKDISEV